MNFNRTIILVVLVAILTVSCKHDHLYYATQRNAIVKVEVDWDEAKINPNGVSAVAYRADGSLYAIYPPQDASQPLYFTLPEGKFDLLFYSNSDMELPALEFIDSENFETFGITALQTDAIREVEPEDIHRALILEPDMVASAVLDDLVITQEAIDVFYDRPQSGADDVMYEHKVVAKRDVATFVLTAYVKGIKYAAGAPRTFFKHSTIGHLLANDTDFESDMMHEFVFNNRVFDPSNSANATIRHEFHTFGLLPNPNAEYELDLDFILLDGKHHRVMVDVTQLIDIREDVDGVEKYFVHLELELPEAIGQGDGSFDVDAEEWEDENIEIPM